MFDLEHSGVSYTESPLVTVAMPVYNAGKHLRLAVLSIVRQTFANWELLIIDDGSTDNALQSIADIKDDRIQILRDGKNKGLAARLNECINLARGEFFARMDQDDVSFPERFEQQLEVLKNNSRLDLVAARAITIDENNKATGIFPSALKHGEICAKPWRGFYFPHPTWFGRIEWFRKYGYTVPGPYFCEDQELLLRSYRESQFATVDKILFGYRVRAKTNLARLVNTRLTMLHIQSRNFSGSNQWHFVLLATAAFAAKISRDFSKILSGSIFPLVRDNAEYTVVLKWNEVMACLLEEPKIP